MNLFITALAIVSFLVGLTVLGFAITWITGSFTKKNGIITTGKIGTMISGALLIVALLGIGISGSVKSHQEAKQQQEEARMNKEFKKESKKFKSNYIITAAVAEKVGNNEYDSWGDSIDDNIDSDDDYDVDSAVSDIVDENSDDIENAKDGVNKLHRKLNTLETNDTGKYSYSKYKRAYKELDKMVDFISSPSGSYLGFSDKFSDFDDKVSDLYKDL